ncbi:Usher syndrome type-1G protein homolog isoform X2 [Athalia rosae]|uniref:Usher syndrome type-1G protein homolog isoform X2 n=1 Tax=Athalia rosae TaxID=37344 RepID=UPI0006250D93|nr:Usher syndrome type-1G protein homolog isoform X2 [Athalia rosae]
MSSERYHKAARDGALEILKEATRRDCNARDEGGMTPTLWAAFEGNIDALRLLVARGGDPDKADYFGNTALHLAAARGHRFCVNFLVKFGTNIWSLDIDRHSARELAAINGRDEILQYLDLAQAEQELNNRKKTKLLRERAEKEAEKRLKEYAKRQKSAEIRAEKEHKKLLKDKTRMMDIDSAEPAILPHRPSILTFRGKIKPSPTFSDIVSGGTKRQGGAVGRKIQARKAADDFKVGEIEMDGKRSVRSLTGLRRDSEVMYVGTYETHSQQVGKRGKISDVWGTLNKAKSTPDLLGDRIKQEEEPHYDYHVINSANVGDTVLLQQPASIFNRPGFGSVAFRRSVTTTLDAIPIGPSDILDSRNVPQQHDSNNGTSSHNNEEVSIGSAGSLARRQSTWDDDLISDEDETEEVSEEWTPLKRFLVANNLSSIHTVLEAEQIDLEALMLLTEADVLALKLPLGPRRKLINAIALRKRALENPSEVIEDSRL